MNSEAITNNRLSYMDIAKGFGILCVIAGHMGNETINRFVFSFHMPLFFLISGYFYHKRTPLKNCSTSEASSYFLHIFSLVFVYCCLVYLKIQLGFFSG